LKDTERKILDVSENCASVISILLRTFYIYMPVDREPVYESLKWIDSKVYRAHLRLKYREITDEEFQRDSVSFYKL